MRAARFLPCKRIARHGTGKTVYDVHLPKYKGRDWLGPLAIAKETSQELEIVTGPRVCLFRAPGG
jgi:hypothetical protein